MATKIMYRVTGQEGADFRVRDNGGVVEMSYDGGTTWVAATELNTLSGLTATTAELNSTDKSAGAVIDPAADASLTQATHAGEVVLMSSADGDTFTLPAAAGTGDIYTVIVSTTVTSNNHIIQVANATDEFLGVIYQVDTDTSDSVAAYPALDSDGFDTITMNGTTTGGLKGDKFVITDVAAGHWQLIGHTNATGSVATPLSAAVS